MRECKRIPAQIMSICLIDTTKTLSVKLTCSKVIVFIFKTRKSFTSGVTYIRCACMIIWFRIYANKHICSTYSFIVIYFSIKFELVWLIKSSS